MGFTRYQRGYVKKVGKKVQVWYGGWREDIRLPDGSFTRRCKKKRLGTVRDLPTKAAAYEELFRLMGCGGSSVEMTFAELAARWEKAIVPTLKNTTADYYQKVLRAHGVPVFGPRRIASVGRYDIETFLAERAPKYCRNTLRGMRVSIGKVFSWAVACGWLEKNPCAGVRLPNAGIRIIRTILKSEETIAIAKKLTEPYSTLVLFLAVTGLRIGEAIAIKWSDFEGDVLNVSRRIYEGEEGTTKTKKSERGLPIPHVLLARMKALGGSVWVFRSLASTPVNPGNALKRYVRPAARELGIPIGGWHDFRHTLGTMLRKKGWSSKVRADILGHSIDTTEQIYDHSDGEDFRAALDEMALELLPNATKSVSVN